jgi:predicted ATPase/class 3 adenylate cyclase
VPLHIYLPQDRIRALANNTPLSDRTRGAALFADISGFTALTEVLRDVLGLRRGAEELSQRLEAVYTTLIGEIERHGGSVISFAGDSLLCWFDEVGVGEQKLGSARSSPSALAVSCGLALQRLMRAYANVTPPEMPAAALTLKVAIASGPARRFVVGDPHIQAMDVLAGTTIRRTALGEHLAQQGNVVIDEATAMALGHSLTIQEWRSDTNSSERFAVITALSQPIETPVVTALEIGDRLSEALRAWVHAPVYERERSGQGAFLTEFRPCITLFVRFTGIDFDSHAAGTHLDAFVGLAQQIAARHGGTLLDLTIGDKGSYVYVNFGVFSTYEDDARRAANAALELRDATRQLDFLLPLQIGMTQGVLRVGPYGGQTRKTFGALGDDVNLAARLMMSAALGEILLSSHAHKPVERFFVFEPRSPISIKGKAEPLPIFALTGERRQRAIRLQEPAYSLPMVGRQSELGIVNSTLELALAGKSQVIGIVAEAGMGKSRLVAEVIRLAHKKGFVGFGGACQSDGINTPYLAWKSIWSAFFDVNPSAPLRRQIRNLEGEIEDRAPDRVQAMPLLNNVLDLEIPENDFTRSLEPQYRKSALHAMFEDCLRAASHETPLLIVVDDLQWVDALSHDLLDEMAKALADCPIAFVVAYRPQHLERLRLQSPRHEGLPQFTRIELHELSRAEGEQVIRAKIAQLYPARTGAIPGELVDKLMARAQGNPFYLEELLNLLRDRGLDPRDARVLENIELPDSLHTLVLSRLDQLSEREKTTLRAASIIGRFFRALWLAGYYPALGELPQVKVDLDQLAQMDITPLESEPELAYLFRHIVMHEVTYESLSYALRAQLHEALAQYLEKQIEQGAVTEASLLDTLVYHYTHSGNQAKQRAYLAKAVTNALEISAYNTALGYLTRLWDLTPAGDPARFALALHLAEAHFHLGDLPVARAALEQAQAAATNDAERALALAIVAEMMSSFGDYAGAQRILEQAIPLARASNNHLTLCRALYALGDVYWHVSRLEEATLALKESLALARELGDVTRELFALNRLATVVSPSDRAEAVRLYRQVHTRALAVGNRERAMVALNNLGADASRGRQWAAARDYDQQALALAREIGTQADIALFLMNLAFADIHLGGLGAARAALREGLALALRLGALSVMVTAVSDFADLAHAEGRTDRALALLGLARRHPAWDSVAQLYLELMLAEWGLDPEVVEAGLRQGAALDWDETIQVLLKG